ncbi:MAG: hypothetical protein CMG61_00335, partial [Candidatus Marinimicrobia bacterium]|nr:hypothetical protein [Candidatus Neomarinimicrobiota bacterium]
MKRIIFILTLSTFLFTQQAEITNIQASQRTDGSQIVDITYDLLPDPIFEFFEISVLVSLDGGQSYTIMSNVSGDLGDIIEPGNGKTLTWNFGQQFGETYSDQIKIKIQGSSYALVDNNSNQELPFEMVTVAAGEYTFGENDEIRTIDYDYEIMKYEVTDQDYVLFMMDKLSSGELDCSEPILCGPESEEGYILDCDGTGECWHPAYIADGFCDGNDQPFGANLCCYNLDGGDCTFAECVGSTDCLLGGYDSFVNDDFFGGYYPGDANHPAGDYNFIEFSNSKISYNGIFEVQEGNVNHPVTGVTWFGAWAFATYYGMEVPDQYEWEKAARGNTGYQWPFGDNFSINQNGNTVESNFTFHTLGGPTTPIGFFNGDTYQCNDNIGFTEHLFFSEYAEGSSNNKFLEIYNPTSKTINLGFYSISRCSNGCDQDGVFDYPAYINFNGGEVVLPGDVYVVCHQNVDSAIAGRCDMFTSQTLSNGDDATALTNNIGTFVFDTIGSLGPDPGSGWDVCGESSATFNHTLVRKSSVSTGNTDWTASAGTSAVDCEWIVYDQNEWSYVGNHSGPYYDDEEAINPNDCEDLVTINSISPFGLYDMAGNV